MKTELQIVAFGGYTNTNKPIQVNNLLYLYVEMVKNFPVQCFIHNSLHAE